VIDSGKVLIDIADATSSKVLTVVIGEGQTGFGLL
jgi:hypothetical protein